VLVEAVKSRPRDLVVEAPLYAHRESGGYAEWFDELRCAVVARV
jgi:tRNA1(Val) A37 N6-methylase TrmN6